jgi:ATP-binding cassette subfamily C protein CydCD
MATLRVAFISGLVLDLLATLSVAVVAVGVGLRLDYGHVSLQVALAALLLAPEVFAPLRAVGAQHHAAEEGRVAAAAALDLLHETSPTEPAPDQVPLPLSIRGLTVCYEGRTECALTDLDLDLCPGELVAVQGISGGGKSSLLAVLLGFVAPARGTVTLTGSTDPLRLDSAEWRANVAWLPQLPRPTQTNVGAEVALGDPAASPAEVLAAIADCHAPDPATPLGEDGAAVSAGQRRRVALARALVRARSVRARGGVPLVLLDEPSEDLDQQTERVVASVVQSMAGWATVLMVTHSPGLAVAAGRRVVLHNGRLVSDVRRAVTVPAPVAARPPLPYRPVTTMTGNVRPSLRPLLSGLPGAGRRLAFAGILSGATGLAGLALTATSVWLICRAAQHPNLQALALAVVGVRTFALAKAVLRYGERIVSHDVALRLLAELRARVFAALEPLAPGSLAEFGRGDLLRRFVSDVDGVQEGLVRAVVPLAGAALTASGAVIVAALLSPLAALVLAAGLVIGLVLAPALALRAAGSAASLSAAAALRDQRTNALLDGLPELTAYGATCRAMAGIAEAEAEFAAGARRPAAGAAMGALATGAAAAVTLPLVLVIASAAARHGLALVSAGVLVAAVLAGFDAVAGIPTAFAALSRLRRGLDRVAALLSTTPPLQEPPVRAMEPGGALTLSFVGVAVAPAPMAQVVVHSATLRVQPGSRVALMGPSGCGKTTLLKAALRLLPVAGGEVSLSGDGPAVPVAALSAAQVPPLVAGSLQGDHVFDASLRDNLRVVRPDASDADLDRVAERAGLRGFVPSLPLGWSTAAGADGRYLSGGQRQRLLLARALLADPAVLVLDEPTAHLDEQTGRAVLVDLLASTRGSTVLLSTHRLPEDDALRILTFADGYVRPAPANLVTTVLP